MEDGDPIAEARAEPAHRLRGERDLGNQDDRRQLALERSRGGLEVHLRLPAARRPMEEEVASGAVQRRDDASHCILLRGRQARRLRLSAERVALGGRTRLATPGTRMRCDQGERTRGSRPVVVRQPERELDERGRDAIDDRARVRDLEALGSRDTGRDDDAPQFTGTEPDAQNVSARDAARRRVRERPRQRTRGHERIDLDERHSGRA